MSNPGLFLANDWTTHWLEAEGDLGQWKDRISMEIAYARQAVASVCVLPRLDIVVQRLSGAVIPEIGVVGHSYRKGCLTLTLDPTNPNFATTMTTEVLRRQVAHEVHHCLRHAGPGYGRTFGEALVSEGLAGQFVAKLFGSPPELWECAVPRDRLDAALLADTILGAENYDHREWFFGSGGRHPRWLGYSLGYEVARLWLLEVGNPDGTTWTEVTASSVLAAAQRQWPETT